jgi:adenylate cyclase
MNKEIERKFLVDTSKLNLENSNKTNIKQGYINDLKIILKNNFIFICKDNKEFLIEIEDSFNLNSLFFNIVDPVNGDYLFNYNNDNVFRIRTVLTEEDKIAFLTIKGKSSGISRDEFEYKIDYNIAISIIDFCCSSLIEKTRYIIPFDNKFWEIDFFEGDNKGLVVAELELEDENITFKKPEWILEEVSYDKRYFNNNLLTNPYKNWYDKT